MNESATLRLKIIEDIIFLFSVRDIRKSRGKNNTWFSKKKIENYCYFYKQNQMKLNTFDKQIQIFLDFYLCVIFCYEIDW